MTLAERGVGPSAEALLALGDRVRLRLSNPDDLHALAVRIGEVAGKHSAPYVIGASPDGDRLAGAAAVSSAGRLRLWKLGEPDARVLVVDTVLITGTQLARTIAGLRLNGASAISAAVVQAHRDAAGRISEGLGVAIESLEPWSE